MNILYLAHRIPYPPNKGDKIRSYHQIKHLAKTHNVYLACLIDDPHDFQYIDELKKLCKVVETSFRSSLKQLWPTGLAFLRGQPLSVGAFYSRELQQKIHAILGSVSLDRIIVFSSPMAEYVRDVKGVPKLMDFVDMDSEKWRAYSLYQKFPFSSLYRFEADRLGRYESTIGQEFEQSVFISSEEAQTLRDGVNGLRVAVVSNGVDLEFFQKRELSTIPSSSGPTIVFTAAMDYFPNVDAVQYFCGEILPTVHESFPEVSFDIVGRSPDAKVRQLANSRHIHVTGTVPDVRPYLERAIVAVAPLRIARGVQNKILEAMAMGLPVVGTSNAFQGIAVGPDDGVRIADDPDQFAEEVLRFLNDASLRDLCGAQARTFVEQHCCWEDCGAELEKLVQEMR